MGWDEWHLEVPSLSRARGLERRIPEPPAKKKSLHDGIESGFSLKWVDAVGQRALGKPPGAMLFGVAG
jgi:hypothetical protein